MMHHNFQLWDPAEHLKTPDWGWAQPLADGITKLANEGVDVYNKAEGALHGIQEIFRPLDNSNFAQVTKDALSWFVSGKIPDGNLFARYGADTNQIKSSAATKRLFW